MYQFRFSRITRLFLSAIIFAAVVVGAASAKAQATEVTLTLAGFAVPREAYAEIIPLFQAKWLKEKNQKVIFKESYVASGAQSRAIVGGFEADVATLSIERDITRIVDAKLITYDWKDNPYKGFVASSVAILTVRAGNPAGIKDWADLTKPGIEVITPDPATSGGAQWNLLAAYGAAKRGNITGIKKDDEEAALTFLGEIIKNVAVFDKDGRESFLTFEKGVGTVAITYENEAYAGLAAGSDFEIVYPPSTILIENPTAVIDVYATKHGVLDVAKAFVEFTYSPEAQLIWAKKGFRPTNKNVLEDKANLELFKDKFQVIKDQFTIDEFKGWGTVAKELFGETGKITKLIADVRAKK